MTESAAENQYKKERREFLEPLRGEPKIRPFLTFDIESKDGDSQRPGFTRPFMLGFYDGIEYKAFWNDEHVNDLPWYERCIARGGCIDKFMRYLLGETSDGRFTNRYKDHDVYAHNMGSFDGLFFPVWFQKNNSWISYKIMPVQSKIQMMEVWRYNPARPRGSLRARRQADSKDRKQFGVLKILDTVRVMPMPLDKIIKMFKLREGNLGKKEIDLALPETEIEEWNEYNKIDTVKLWEARQRYGALIESMGGEVGITAPSTAVKLLRRRYIPDKFRIYRNIHFTGCKDPECLGCAHEFFRTAYYGGRTEIYMFVGYGFYYDVNSSYPSSMKQKMPIGEMEALGENEDFSRFTNGDHVGFVRCTVEIPDDVYLPPLPVPHGGKLKFPVGRFSGTWDWVELRSLKRVGGRILHVEKSVWIRAAKFMDHFVDDLYAMRQKNSPDYDEGRSETAKIMLNSTFGKFGMEQEREEVVILKPGEDEPFGVRMPGESVEHWKKRRNKEMGLDPDAPTPGADENEELPEVKETKEKAKELRIPLLRVPSGIFEHDSLVRVRDIRVDAAYIIPQISAHITALSRHLLWCYSMDILDKKGKIYYSDTDSVLTDYGDIPDSKDLGGVKKEFGGECMEITAFAPKMYVLRKKTPFPGTHIREESSEGKAGEKLCLDNCPGCKKDEKGKPISGEHEVDGNGNRACMKTCPGCSTVKVMMKGVPKDLRTYKTLERMHRKEEVKFKLLQKLGSLMKGQFHQTPQMVDFKKSFKSEYDKRIRCEKDPNDTRPISISDDAFLSTIFKENGLKPRYKVPVWLDDLLGFNVKKQKGENDAQ
jgi:hypothetical protein